MVIFFLKSSTTDIQPYSEVFIDSYGEYNKMIPKNNLVKVFFG